MSVRLEEVNEREQSMKACLQTVDLRLAQLEEFAGRMMNATQKLAGLDQLDFLQSRSRKSSVCDPASLCRHGSIHSCGGFSLHQQQLEPEDQAKTEEKMASETKMGLKNQSSMKELDFGSGGEGAESKTKTECDLDCNTKPSTEPAFANTIPPPPKAQREGDGPVMVLKAKLEAALSYPLEHTRAQHHNSSPQTARPLTGHVHNSETEMQFCREDGTYVKKWASQPLITSDKSLYRLSCNYVSQGTGVNTTQNETIHTSDLKGSSRKRQDLTEQRRQKQTEDSGEFDMTGLLSGKSTFYAPLRSKSLNAYPWKARGSCDTVDRSCRSVNSEHDLSVACGGISKQHSAISSKKKGEEMEESLLKN